MTSLALSAATIFAADARAQQAPIEYGPGMTLEIATKAVNAAMAEAKKNNWNLAIAVTTNGGHLVHFSRMDQTQFGSIAIAQHKARAAAKFKRPTKAFADAIAAAPGNVALLTLDDIIASEGGIPLMMGGKMIGAIGCSGATGQQDGVACTAGAGALK
jgi:uncharacterized protein GlcG (DUF336 family)